MTGADDGRWHPGIGDPTVIGWVTVAAYAVATLLCVMCARRERTEALIRSHDDDGDPRRLVFWAGLGVAMLLLGINKQLDLQTWFTEVGRDMAKGEGWYDNRRAVQAAFITLLAGVGVISQVWLFLLLRDFGGEVRWAGIGLVALTLFILMRATSFHHVDLLLGMKIGGWLKVNALLELGGVGCIAAATVRRLRRRDLAAAR